MKMKTPKKHLTVDAIIAALDPMNVSLANDDDLREGALKALDRGFKDAKAALDFALAWRSGFRDGRASLGYQQAEAEQEPTVDAEAIREAERERIKAIVDAAPVEKQAAALALAFGSDLPAEQVLEVLTGLPMPEATAPVSRRPLGLIALDIETGEEKILPEGLGAMHYDPFAAKSDPTKAGWQATIAKINGEQK